ncbi:MAG: uridine kinase [Chloroflexi bacterium]|nr:MAG: uridine kinase [Chloroflexota bacterium]
MALPHPHPLRIAIDGMDAAGKTILADELSAVLIEKTSRLIIRASIDRFHNPREVRYRQGENSPEGYYADSFDLAALRQNLLDPLGPGGSRAIRTELFDFSSDSAVPSATVEVPADAILLFDGIFLHRPELVDCWDFSIFVQVTYETVLTRAVKRDGARMGGWQGVLDRYMTRYLPAQRRYLETCRPDEHAGIVVVNDDPLNPEFRE